MWPEHHICGWLQMRAVIRSPGKEAISGCPWRGEVVGRNQTTGVHARKGMKQTPGVPKSLRVEKGKNGWANSVRESQDKGRSFFFICLFLGCRDLITFGG